MTACAVWLLPDPDSPTIATVSPGATSRSRPFTACSTPSPVRKRTSRPRRERRGMATGRVGCVRTSGFTARGAVARRAEKVDGDVGEGRGEPLVPAEPDPLRAGPAAPLPRRPRDVQEQHRHRRCEGGEIGRVAEVAAGILGEAAGEAAAPQPRHRRRRAGTARPVRRARRQRRRGAAAPLDVGRQEARAVCGPALDADMVRAPGDADHQHGVKTAGERRRQHGFDRGVGGRHDERLGLDPEAPPARRGRDAAGDLGARVDRYAWEAAETGDEKARFQGSGLSAFGNLPPNCQVMFPRRRARTMLRGGKSRLGEPTMTLGTILLIILILLLIGAIPNWGYSRGWGYGPSGIVGVILIVVIILLLMGRL